MSRYLLLLTIVSWVFSLSAEAQPSFDCAKATTATEVTICSSGRLAELDVALSAAYQAARSQLSTAGREQLLAEQKAWLAQRDTCQSDALCLAASMEARLAELANPDSGGMDSAQTTPQPSYDGSTFSLPTFGAQLAESNNAPPPAESAVPDGIWNARFTCGKGNRAKDYAARLLTMSEHGAWGFFQVAPMGEANPAPVFALLRRNEKENAKDGHYTKEFTRGGIRAVWRFFIRPTSAQTLSVDYGPCKDIQFVREQPTLDNPNFEGRWSGFIEACESGGGAVETNMTVFAAHDGNVFADVGYRLFPNEPPGKDYPGRAFLYGVWDAASQEYRFAAIKTGGPVRSGARGYTWGGLANLSLKHDGADGSLVGKTDNCSYVALRKNDPNQPNRAESTAPTTSLLGRWEGEAICRNGDTFFGLTINNEQADRILGVLDIAGPDALMRGVTALDVQLRKGQETGDYQGAVASQASLQSFRLSSGGDGNTLALSEDDLGCGEVELTRIDDTALSRLPTATAANGGSFFSNRRPQDRCEAIVALPQKFEREFPEISMLEDPSEKVYPKLVLLYGDDDWVPVFGQPFDAMPLNERREIRNDARQLCYNDPFYSDDYYKFSMLDRGLTGNPERPLTSFGLPAIHIAVRQIREIRHQLKASVDEALSASSVEDAAPKKRRISAFMRNNEDRLWPSEIEAVEGQLGDHLASLALADVEAELVALNQTDDVSAKLSALTDMASGNREYHKYLDDRNMAALKERAVRDQTNLAEAHLSDALAEIEALPESRTGLAELEQREAEIQDITSLLIDSVGTPIQSRIDRKQQTILNAIFNEKLGALNALQPTRDGLEDSLRWLEDFNSLFTPYRQDVEFDQALEAFTAKRAVLLEGSLGQFEQDVEQAAAEGGANAVDQVAETYLAWEGDQAIPVWLDYQFIAESYK